MESDQHKLFVGGISRETSEDALRDHFGKYGGVSDAVVAKEKITGISRCFGFVRFSDASSAEKALRDTHVILGRTVDVKKAVPKCTQLQVQQQPKQHPYNELQVEQNSRVHEQGSNGNQRTKKIFVGGLSSSVTEEEFKIYFERFGPITDVVVMHDSATNRPRGFGFVTFESEESVVSVMQNNFHELNSKLVEVKRAIPKKEIHSINRNQEGSNFDNSRSVGNRMYDPDTAMLSSNGVQGFHYPIAVYGHGYPYIANGQILLLNNPMMPGTEFYFPPYSNICSYFACTSNGFVLPGNPVGYSPWVGPKLDRFTDSGEHVQGEISSRLKNLKQGIGTEVL